MPLICRAQITSPPLPRIWVVALAGVRGKNSQVGQIPLLKYVSFLPPSPCNLSGGETSSRWPEPISDARAFSEEERRGAERRPIFPHDSRKEKEGEREGGPK